MILFLLAASWFDHKNNKVPNILTLSLFIYTLFCNLTAGGSFFIQFFTIFVVILMFIPLYYLRMLGAGDIKLLAVVVGHIGENVEESLRILFCIIIVGGCISLVIMIKKSIFLERLRYLKEYIINILYTRKFEEYSEFNKESKHHMKFTYSILLGYIMWLILKKL